MDAIMDFLGNIWVMVGMGVLLIILIVVFFIVRNKKEED